MVVQRVFVVWTHPLFFESVRLILNHPAVEWLGSTSHYADAKELILSLRPDAVLMEEATSCVPSLAIAILEACTWDIRVIGIKMTDNKLWIYHREHRIVRQAEDLLSLIQND